jgi:hypothetical protein
MKWSVGRPRPEEIAMQIQNDLISTELDGVPAGVVKVQAMHFDTRPRLYPYDEGCPPFTRPGRRCIQPSAASLWLAVVADLTPGSSIARFSTSTTRCRSPTVQASITRLRVYLLGTIWARRFLRDSQTRCSFDGKYEERILRLFSREIDSLTCGILFFADLSPV